MEGTGSHSVDSLSNPTQSSQYEFNAFNLGPDYELLNPGTARVWKDFLKVKHTPTGDIWAYCKICRNKYKHSKGSGTSSLQRHIENKHGSGASGSQQTQLEAGGVGFFQYNHDRCVSEMAKLIMSGEQTLGFGEKPQFERFVQSALQPQFRRVPRNTVKDRCFVRYKEQKEYLTAILSSLDSSIALTSDIWTDRIEVPWICITAHWIDSDWIIQKRIIAFRKFPPPHTGYNIVLQITTCLDEYKILNKIFSISFDNASNNVAAIPDLIRRCKPILNGEFFHVRCACHILNLAVQEALEATAVPISKIKSAILCIKHNYNKRKLYRDACAQLGVTPGLKKDVITRWNSTYDMLTTAIRTADAITIVWNDSVIGENQIFDYDWQVAKNLHRFLKTFKKATERFSACYSPTSHILFEELYNIAILFTKFSDDPVFIPIILSMQPKLVKYYEDIPYLYAVASVLDPRAKLELTTKILNVFHSSLMTNIDVVKYMANVEAVIQNMYVIYYSRLNDTTRDFPTHVPVQYNYEDDLDDPFAALQAQHKRQATESSTSSISYHELTSYYNTNFYKEIESMPVFDILTWWKSKRFTYPVLSAMARDVLTVPVSTVASERAFSTGERVLSEKRCSLAEDTMECLICYQDWDLANTRTQHLISLDVDEEQATEGQDLQ